MDKIFYFLRNRESKEILKEEYDAYTKRLYIDKVENRINNLKKLEQFKMIEKFIEIGTEFETIDKIVQYYQDLYNKITLKYGKWLKNISVIGHGDLFFGNMLYSKDIDCLKFIDPKGAIQEEELWTNPYYDVAKLSHSICGNYDFFNVGAYSIELNNEMKLEIKIHFDNTEYIEVFKKYLQKEGYDYVLVRLYEASLFLSMLPLHIDNVNKVIGFLLNAINILKEIEENV